jgi:hypothetical protein
MSNNVFNRVRQSTPIQCCSFTLRDLEQLARIVFDKNSELVAIEHTKIKNLQCSAEEQLKYIQLVTDQQKMTIFIDGSEGEHLIAYDPSIFQSHTLPSVISSVVIENQTYRQVTAKIEPENHIRIQLDFSRLIFAGPKFTAAGTLQNNSILIVQGFENAWVTSAYKVLYDRLKSIRNARGLLHSKGTYELGLVLVAFPTLIFLIDKIYNQHQDWFDSFGIIFRIGGVCYAFILGLIAYRLLFNYALWTFPSVDLINERDKAATHRKIWFSITMGLVTGFIGYYLYRK